MNDLPCLSGASPAAAAPQAPSVFRRFERLQRLGLGGFLALVLVLALLALAQGQRLVHGVQVHRQTQALVGEINRVRMQLLDVEEALHVFELSANPVLLQQRLRCDPPCGGTAALQALAQDPAQQALLARLADSEATLRPALQQALREGPGAATLPLPVIAQMRRLLLQAEDAELGQLRRHDEARRAQGVQLQLVLGLTLLLAFGGALLLQRRTGHLVRAGLRAEAALEAASLRDPLTGAFNRRALDLYLERLLCHAQHTGQPLAVLALDLDGFKAVNDGHGHGAGDAALQEITARLQAQLRETDLLTRTGGDEFVIVLRGREDEAGAQAAAQRLLQALAAPLTLPGGAPAQLGASIGLAQFPRDGSAAPTLLHAADAACYAAKRSGKNRVCSAGHPVAGHAPAPVPAAPRALQPALRRVC